MTTADRVVDRLAALGWKVKSWGELHRWRGQGMMNRAAGMDAPTWDFECTLMDGRRAIVESHIPVGWILKQPTESVSVDDEDFSSPGMLRLHLDTRTLPASWRRR
jgi:hypothetical protein